MNTEHDAWSTLHPHEHRRARAGSCACGQDVDSRRQYCIRCGSTVALASG
jgi:hypothetical protein